MLTASWTKTIRDADKVALIDGIEYRDDGVLDDFVLQRRDAERSLSTIGLRDVGSSHRLCSVAAAVYRGMQRAQPAIQPLQILLPHHAVDTGCRATLERVEAFPKPLHSDVMQKRCEACSLILPCCFAHTLQVRRRGNPALGPDRGSPHRVPLGRRPSLHSLRRLRGVRLLLRYYAAVRLPTPTPIRLIASSLP